MDTLQAINHLDQQLRELQSARLDIEDRLNTIRAAEYEIEKQIARLEAALDQETAP